MTSARGKDSAGAPRSLTARRSRITSASATATPAVAGRVTLVVEVTNFTGKTNYRGSRENLHLIERYRRLDDSRLSVEITVEDPTTWTGPWTAMQELALNSDQANQVYEGGCHEGNYGMTGMLANTRAAEAFLPRVVVQTPPPRTMLPAEVDDSSSSYVLIGRFTSLGG